MEFGQLLKSSWDRYIKEIVSLVLFALVGMLLSVTIVLIPTVTGGFVRGFLGYVRDGKKPEFNELWNFEDYLQILLLILVAGLLISTGYVLLVIPGIIFNVWWLYSFYFLVDRKLGCWEAMTASRGMVSNTGFFNHLIILLIFFLLNAVGGSFSGLGTIFTLPLPTAGPRRPCRADRRCLSLPPCGGGS